MLGPPIQTTVTSSSAMAGSSSRAEAMSVSDPRQRTNRGCGSSESASETMARAPGLSTGVSGSDIARGEPSRTTTESVRSIAASRRASSTLLAPRLSATPRWPKCVGTTHRTSRLGERSAYATANASSASFATSVLITTRRRGGTSRKPSITREPSAKTSLLPGNPTPSGVDENLSYRLPDLRDGSGNGARRMQQQHGSDRTARDLYDEIASVLA